MPHQISVFAENKPGKIERVAKILAENKINIRAVTLSDAGDYGIIKLLVDKPYDAEKLLQNAGMSANLKEVIAVKLSDKPGGLAEMSALLNSCDINVEDAYGFIIEKGQTAIFVFQVANPSHAENILKDKGLQLLTDRELYTI